VGASCPPELLRKRAAQLRILYILQACVRQCLGDKGTRCSDWVCRVRLGPVTGFCEERRDAAGLVGTFGHPTAGAGVLQRRAMAVGSVAGRLCGVDFIGQASAATGHGEIRLG